MRRRMSVPFLRLFFSVSNQLVLAPYPIKILGLEEEVVDDIASVCLRAQLKNG
jgi:hypothetical protein